MKLWDSVCVCNYWSAVIIYGIVAIITCGITVITYVDNNSFIT